MWTGRSILQLRSTLPPAPALHLLSNRAEAFLKLDEYQAARECATAALEIDPAHGKSLHRRARALRQLGPWIGGDAALAGAEADLKELHAPRRRRGRGRAARGGTQGPGSDASRARGCASQPRVADRCWSRNARLASRGRRLTRACGAVALRSMTEA